MTVEPTSTAPVPATTTPGPDAARIAKRAGLVTVLAGGWLVQYAAWVPLVLCWRLFLTALRIATKVGVLGILLLFLPVIGWILLIVIWNGRKGRAQAERYHAETMAALGHGTPAAGGRSLWEPWGVSLLRG